MMAKKQPQKTDTTGKPSEKVRLRGLSHAEWGELEYELVLAITSLKFLGEVLQDADEKVATPAGNLVEMIAEKIERVAFGDREAP